MITPKFDTLTVDWKNHAEIVHSLMISWLVQMGVEGVNGYTYHDIMLGKVLIIPHRSWVYSGLSGSSTPNNVVLDYSNRSSALRRIGDVETYLRERQFGNILETSKNKVVHYGDGSRLCGNKSFTELGKEDFHLTKNIGKVTCPHCKLEIIVRIPTDKSNQH